MSNGAVYPSLKDRVVLVTGGAGGIGASIVEHFCRQQARVGFLDYDRQGGEALARRLAAEGLPEPAFEHCDLRDIDALRAAVSAIAGRLGPVTVLVNNAAHDERHDIDAVTPEYWDDRMAVNLRHQFFAVQAVWKDMAAAGGGAVVNLGSVTWMIGQGGMPGYSAAKSAVVGLTRSLARDLGPHNIRVNSVLPGWIMTERQVEKWLTPEGEADLMRNQCLKRKLVPDDVARVVVFFASDEAAACTNQNYIVDGGWV
ncbi:SDR family oxidoreductase [Thalassobaculum sp.]|uniref:SDR family NAD(P)-dependent oxidoreductase n=1 Tax=Thalassobaculum sp. TaxID=2022740 RepID=UPI0032ED4BAA